MAIATILRSGSGTDTSDATATAEYILTGWGVVYHDQLWTNNNHPKRLSQWQG